MTKRRCSQKKGQKDLSRTDRNTKAAIGMIFFLSAVFLLFNSFLGEKSLFQLHRMQVQKEWWTQENARRTQENALLRNKIRAAHDDLFIVEKIAREELGMVRENEVVYLFDPREIRNAGNPVSNSGEPRHSRVRR